MTTAQNRTRAAIATSAVVALAMGVAACGGSSSTSSSTSSGGSSTTSGGGSAGAGTSGDIKIGAALIGPKNDKSFNQAAYEGIVAATKANPRLKLTSTLENRATDQTRTDAVETLAPINKVVAAVSASFGPVLDVEAVKFPNTYFINIAGFTQKFHKNVTGFANDWGAPAYVGGVLAAKHSKSGIVGYVGGAEIPPTIHGQNGFEAGAKSVNPKIKVLKNIVGDFNDVAKAKAATAAMISNGADVIFPFLDAGIAGSYQAGKESGKNPAMFKLTVPDCGAYSNMIGTEVVNNFVATSKMLEAYAAGTLQPGAIFLDLQDPELQTLKLCPKYAKDPVLSKATAQTIADVNSGKVKLPANAINARPSYPYKEGLNGKTINPGSGG
jgi:basic membrane protein A